MAEENKRYSIVRVDDKCPIVEVGICDNRMCKACEFIKNVYGDTREDFKNKIKTAIVRVAKDIKAIYSVDGDRWEISNIDYFAEKMAANITTYLGVK